MWNRGREYAVTFTDANGEIIGRRGIRQDDAIPLGEIPPHLIKAVLATEDARFFEHFGVDVIGTLRAIVENARANDVVQGGSSLTQQVAKNLFLSPERTIRRKVHEAFLSLWIEARLSKEEILKLYLDRSYLGGGDYGVEAASQFYFGKSVRDINLLRSGHAGRPVQGALEICAAPEPGSCPRPRQHGALPHARLRASSPRASCCRLGASRRRSIAAEHRRQPGLVPRLGLSRHARQ